LPQEILIH